jgi:hypothetical protein
MGYFSLGQTRSARVEESEPALLATSGYVVNNKYKKGMYILYCAKKLRPAVKGGGSTYLQSTPCFYD